jgi:hypothetical protein
VFVGVAGLTFLVKAGGGLYWLIPAAEPLLLLADLLYALGGVLWTGVVLVVFIQIYPETKKRQFKRALDAYEAAVGDQARAGTGKPPDPAGAGDI